MPTGQTTQYDLQVGIKVLMDELIYTYTPDDLPMLTGMGADGLSVLSTEPIDQVTFNWMDEELLTPRDTLAGNIVATDTVFTVTDRTKFSTGDVFMVRKSGASADAEHIKVASYGTTANTLICTRAYAGTATTYATSSVVIGLGTALAEGSDPEAFRSKDRVKRTGYTQIFGPTKVQMSRTHQQITRYGVSNELDRQLRNRVYENGQSREQAYLYGVAADSTTTEVRTTGGLVDFISSVVDSINTQLTETAINSNLQTCYNNGGVPKLLMANPYSLGTLNALTDSNRVRVEIDDARRGRIRVEQVWTEFGAMTIVRNRFVHPFDAFGFSREQATRCIIQPLVFEMLAKTGDSDKGQIVAEEGMKFKGEKHAFRFANLTSYTAV